MNTQIECAKCHAHMEVGYTPYFHGGGGYARQYWYPGEPKSHFWTGLTVKKDQCVPITTLRCPNCGYLESYAIKQAEAGS
jgi:predicted nucleic-acid-binding Zn-ribbon protein